MPFASGLETQTFLAPDEPQIAQASWKWSDSDVREHRELTARKLVWTLNDGGAQPRLCNIDDIDEALAHWRERVASVWSCAHRKQGLHHDGARNASWLAST